MTSKVELKIDSWTQIRDSQCIQVQDVRELFPSNEVPVTIHTNVGDFKAILDKPYLAQSHFHLTEWFNKNEEQLKPGDKLIFIVDQPMKEYSLII
jgi:hypothetical protein